MKLYHVLGKKFSVGENIYSYERAVELDLLSEEDYQWSEYQDYDEYVDWDIICFHSSASDAVEWANDQNLDLIAVLDSDDLPASVFTNVEGFPCVALGTITPDIFTVLTKEELV